MAGEKTPPIQDFFDDLERRRGDRRESLQRAVSERRRNWNQFAEARDQVLLPALGRIARELERRGHQPKVSSDDRGVTLTVAVHDFDARVGSLRFRLLDDPATQVRVDLEGVALPQTRYRIELEELSRKLVTRLALHFTGALLTA
ncbi:MAG: hypothetical protein AAF604_20590 [Acidobacteriota bacterium]